MGGKLVHIHADLSHKVASRHPIHAGNALPQGHCRFKRADALVDLGFDPRDPLAQILPLVQVLVQQKAVMIPNSPFQGLLQLGGLVLQLAPCQLRQLSRIVLAADDGLQHLASGYAQRVGGHRTQLEVGLFQKLLDTVGHPRLALPQFRPVPRQIAQVLDRGRRHKAPLEQSVLEQVGDPLLSSATGNNDLVPDTILNHVTLLGTHNSHCSL
jgi:hypothetical protein